MRRKSPGKKNKWVLKDVDRLGIKRLSEECSLTTIQAHLLWCRGFRNPEEVDLFLNPSFDRLYDPFQFNEMEKAVSLVLEAIRNEDLILVHGDLDADGVTGTALLFQFLKEAGANVSYFVPSRKKDGYGLAMRVMKKGVQKGLKLVVSVDCGSNDNEVVSFLKEKGVAVLITDHHETNSRVGADAFLNPKYPAEEYPFRDLAGVGVAFKLVQALAKSIKADFSMEKYIDLVALGTLADYMPLCDENRILVSLGLKAMSKWSRPGLEALRAKSGLNSNDFNARQVCFTIIPRLNSPGRIGSAREVVKLLIENDSERIFDLVNGIEEKNSQRKFRDRRVTEQAYYLADMFLKRGNPNALVFSSPDWHQGVVGIGAARLAERYGLPSALIAVQDNGVCKGSVRSAGTINIKAALERCSSLLIAFGGHKEAGGFSILEENIASFTNMFDGVAREFTGDDLPASVYEADMEISIDEFDTELLSFIELMAPFGPGNTEPLFILRGVDVGDKCRIVGRRHLKFNGRQNSSKLVDFIGFSKGRVWKSHDIYGQKLDILVNFRKNYYRGRLEKQFIVLDLCLSELLHNL